MRPSLPRQALEKGTQCACTRRDFPSEGGLGAEARQCLRLKHTLSFMTPQKRRI